MKIGIALSGGSVRGFCHIGTLIALEENGIKPNIISGNSAGSIIAGLYACGMSTDQLIEASKIAKYKLLDIDYLNIIKSTINISKLLKGADLLSGVIKGDKIEKELNTLTNGIRIKDCKIPIAIPAVDINTAKIVYFTNKIPSKKSHEIFIDNAKLATAIRASVSIPGIFQPKKINYKGRTLNLIDGGIAINLPMDILKTMGAEKIIGVNLGYSGQIKNEIDNIWEIVSQSIEIMMYRMYRLQNQQHNWYELGKSNNVSTLTHNKGIIINPKIYDVSLFEFNRIEEMIHRGYSATKKIMPQINRALEI